ncbi:hypothetical protein GGP86_003265 [Salinibacter ruber]|uniref:hypothetical protein n=1 Tax=Salinibacter ruber TaxID=146919 RepID=UPI00216713FA|nr:hypothetical protein [Salinibacter ruber]MCS3863466.1 hypothetical protein [Salinibacter ruber]
MPTPVKPSKYASAAGYDAIDFVAAVKSGESDYAGVPIGSWRQDGGQFLAVPDAHADQLGLSPDPRPNPSALGRSSGVGSDSVEDNQTSPAKTTGAALADAAPPVSANAGAAYAAGKFADTVKEQPQVMEDVVDGAALLGSAGLAYSTAEEGDVVKAGMTAAGLFGAFKLIRHACEQGNRQTDMQERQQRAQIQQNRQRQLPEKGSQNRSGVTINGS